MLCFHLFSYFANGLFTFLWPYHNENTVSCPHQELPITFWYMQSSLSHKQNFHQVPCVLLKPLQNYTGLQHLVVTQFTFNKLSVADKYRQRMHYWREDAVCVIDTHCTLLSTICISVHDTWCTWVIMNLWKSSTDTDSYIQSTKGCTFHKLIFILLQLYGQVDGSI